MKETNEWKKLMEDLPEPVIFARDGRIIFYNQATLNMLELDDYSDNVMVSNILDNLSWLKQKKSKEPLSNIITKNEKQMLISESHFTGYKNGTKRWITVKRIESEGDADVIEYIFHDMTAMKHLEQDRAREECFDILLATASHDLRTPLNLILGVIDVLADFVNTPMAIEQINAARCCGERMIYYLKGLTYIRQINFRTIKPMNRFFDPVKLTNRIIRSLEFSAKAKNLFLKLEAKSNVPDNICSDKDMYAIIFQNLLENSIKYTYKGKISVKIFFEEEDTKLITEIKDTGIGMNNNQLSNVGMLFNNKKDTCNLNPQGLGLGLYLAKSLAQHLQGSLDIHSKKDIGTIACFSIIGNIEDTIKVEKKKSVIPNIPKDFRCDHPKVLIVDDEPLNLLILNAYLNSVNIKADKAENGELALRKINEKSKLTCCNSYSVIFMDINMPVLDGIETTERIVEMTKKGIIDSSPVVAVTAAANLEDPIIYNEYVAKGFKELCIIFIYIVSKPIKKAQFLKALYKYIPICLT